MKKGIERCCLWCKKYQTCKERPTKTRQCCPAPEQKGSECLALVKDGFCTACSTYRLADRVQTSLADANVLVAADLMKGRRGARPKWHKKHRETSDGAATAPQA